MSQNIFDENKILMENSNLVNLTYLNDWNETKLLHNSWDNVYVGPVRIIQH